jgi:hypothetical protein|tara:strand:- start:587 stop:880 length:294 start_codon:yes stop_codon:yes gene_type:complete
MKITKAELKQMIREVLLQERGASEPLDDTKKQMLQSAVMSAKRMSKGSGQPLRPADVISVLEKAKESHEKNIKDEKLKREKLAQVDAVINHVFNKGL